MTVHDHGIESTFVFSFFSLSTLLRLGSRLRRLPPRRVLEQRRVDGGAGQMHVSHYAAADEDVLDGALRCVMKTDVSPLSHF